MKELPKIFALQTLTPAPQDSVIHTVEMTQITRKMCLILNLVSVFCFAVTICYINFGPKCQLNFHFPLSFLFLPRPTRVPVLLLPTPWHAQLQISHWRRSQSKPPVPAAALRSVRTSSPSTLLLHRQLHNSIQFNSSLRMPALSPPLQVPTGTLRPEVATNHCFVLFTKHHPL